MSAAGIDLINEIFCIVWRKCNIHAMMLILQRATYRVRGDVIDVYPADSEKEAIRIELFDDEVENIKLF